MYYRGNVNLRSPLTFVTIELLHSEILKSLESKL